MMIGRKHTEETKRKMSASAMGNQRAIGSKSTLGLRFKYTLEQRQDRSIRMRGNKNGINNLIQGPSPYSGRGRKGYRLIGGVNIWFRSRWEANFARVLDYLGIHFQYEPKTFTIGNHTYTPDFYIPSKKLYIEIKGYIDKWSRKRDKLLRKNYPNISLIILDPSIYQSVTKRFRYKIPLWEV